MTPSTGPRTRWRGGRGWHCGVQNSLRPSGNCSTGKPSSKRSMRPRSAGRVRHCRKNSRETRALQWRRPGTSR